MREQTPIEVAVTELSPEDAVTHGWLDDAAVYLTLPPEEGDTDRAETA